MKKWKKIEQVTVVEVESDDEDEKAKAENIGVVEATMSAGEVDGKEGSTAKEAAKISAGSGMSIDGLKEVRGASGSSGDHADKEDQEETPNFRKTAAPRLAAHVIGDEGKRSDVQLPASSSMSRKDLQRAQSARGNARSATPLKDVKKRGAEDRSASCLAGIFLARTLKEKAANTAEGAIAAVRA